MESRLELSLNPAERAREKQESRDDDSRAVAEGRMSDWDVEAKNAFLRADRTVVRWERVKAL